MKSVSLRQALRIIGAKDIELRKGWKYETGFCEINGVLHAVFTSDIDFRNSDGSLIVTYRTAKDRTDYVGGTNKDFSAMVSRDHGLKITTCSYKS